VRKIAGAQVKRDLALETEYVDPELVDEVDESELEDDQEGARARREARRAGRSGRRNQPGRGSGGRARDRD
jgi:hypothetical protein